MSSVRLALSLALAAGVAFAAADADAQSRGSGRHSGATGASGGGHGWHGGRHDGWRGGEGRHWNGGRHWDGRHGHHWRGHHWHGWHGGRYYYPGWALGLGVGIGLTYPWWGWGWHYPASYVVYDRGYDAPVGVVIDRDGPVTAPPPAYRWYCPSPPGYHPDVRECSAGWLKVLPHEGGPPRSTAPADEGPASRVVPGAMGSAASPVRIAAAGTDHGF